MSNKVTGNPNPVSLRNSAILLLAVLAGCNTTGDSGVLQSATKPADNINPENPTQSTRQLNTRTDLTDYCPKISLQEGTAIYRVYEPRAKEKNADTLRYQATISRFSRNCSYEQGKLRMSIGVAGRLISGPSGATGTFKLPLRIAIKSGEEMVFNKLYKPDATIAAGKANGNFSFVDNEVWLPAPTARSLRVRVGFDDTAK